MVQDSELKTSGSRFSDPFERLRNEVNRVLDELDLPGMSRKVQDLGREKPVILAFVALSIGLASGILIQRTTSRLEAGRS